MGLFKSDEEKIKELIQAGIEFANKDENEKAIKEFQKALKIDPTNEDALFNLACTYSDIGDTQKSYETFKTLINKNPKHVNAFNNLALMFARQGKYNDALFIYEKGIEQNPDSALLYNNRGNIYFEMGNYVEALKNFKKASDLDPIYSERFYHLGISSYLKEETGGMDDAIKELEQSAKKNMHKSKDVHDLGVAYMERKMYDKAIEAFNNALKIDPNYLSAYINLGYCYQYKEDYVKAIQSFEKAIILNPRSAKLYNTIGLLYDKMGNPEKAVIAYKKAVNLDPTYKNSHYMLGQLYQNRGNFDKAIAEFTKHIKIVESGPTVDDCMQRIAEMKNMTFEQVKELFAPFLTEEKKEETKTPIQQTEKKDANEYLRNLKEKMASKKTEFKEQIETPAESPKQEFKAPVMDPQEYLRKLKEKMKQKKSGGEQIIQETKLNVVQNKISPPHPAVTENKIQGESAEEKQQVIQQQKSPVIERTDEPLIERVDDEKIETVTFEPAQNEKKQDKIFIDPITHNIKNAINDNDEEPPPEYFRQTIIKPVGKNVELPTDKMPEFHKQPSQKPNFNQPVNRSYSQIPHTDKAIEPVQPISPIQNLTGQNSGVQKPSGTIKHDKLPSFNNNKPQENSTEKKDDDDDNFKPRTIKRGFF